MSAPAPTATPPAVLTDGMRRTLTATVHLPLSGGPMRPLSGGGHYVPELLVITYRLDTTAPMPWHWSALLTGTRLRTSGRASTPTRMHRSAAGETWASALDGHGTRGVDGTHTVMPAWVSTQVRQHRPYFPSPKG